ncbi:MAG: choice-of-anchor L domain-containing protein [Myxococcales bacterium]|nr:choice-of-anchor L domain-containing protein [Myxococcales bacterium]
MRFMAWTAVLGLVACNGGGGDGSGGFTVTTPETDPGTSTTMATSTTAPPTSSTSSPTETTATPTTTEIADTTAGETASETTGPPPTTGPDDTSTGESSSSGADDTTAGEVCEAPGLLNVCDEGSDDPFHALGLNCAGAPENTLPISNEKFTSMPVAYTVATGFGSAEDPMAPGELLFRPREGKKLLVISTGRVGALDDDGVLVETTPQYDNANNFNPDNPNALPAPMSPLPGSNGGMGGAPFTDCDGVHDCSDSIDPNWTLGNGDPNDLLFARFDITVPAGTHGFEFDVAFFSSEYPEFVGDKFNDMFIGWSTSEAYTGNVTFYADQPFTVTALAQAMEVSGYVDAAPELAGTGFEGNGSTGWTTVSAPVIPGETFTFAMAIMDMGDSSKATVAVLDAWRWSCQGCVSEADDPACGQDGHPPCCGLCVAMQDDPDCGMPFHPMCCMAG